MSERQSDGHQKSKTGGKGKSRDFKGKGKRNIAPKKENGEEGVGVSKIKAALRQTKRLLAKVSELSLSYSF
jgi:hypothetical protein